MEIHGLSNYIDVDSPRVSGLGRFARVFDVSCNVAHSNAPRPRKTKNTLATQQLKFKHAVMKAECHLREREAELLDAAAAAAVQHKDTQVEHMRELLKRKHDVTKSALDLREHLAELDNEIWLLKQSSVGGSEAIATATIIAQSPCQVDFQLTYRKQYMGMCRRETDD